MNILTSLYASSDDIIDQNKDNEWIWSSSNRVVKNTGKVNQYAIQCTSNRGYTSNYFEPWANNDYTVSIWTCMSNNRYAYFLFPSSNETADGGGITLKTRNAVVDNKLFEFFTK